MHFDLAPAAASFVFVGTEARNKGLKNALAEAGLANAWHHTADASAALDLMTNDDQEVPLLPPFVLVVDAEAPTALTLVEQVRANEELRRVPVFVLSQREADVPRETFHQLHVVGVLKPCADAQAVELLHRYVRLVTLPEL